MVACARHALWLSHFHDEARAFGRTPLLVAIRDADRRLDPRCFTRQRTASGATVIELQEQLVTEAQRTNAALERIFDRGRHE